MPGKIMENRGSGLCFSKHSGIENASWYLAVVH